MLSAIRDSIRTNSGRQAFIIRDRVYTYRDLSRHIAGIRDLLARCDRQGKTVIALYADDSIETYAAVYAIWFEGLTLLPLNSKFPPERNLNILHQAGAGMLLHAGNEPPREISGTIPVAGIRGLISDEADRDLVPVADEAIRYILFTSGSTGTPKGVPVSKKNLDAFLHAFLALGFDWNREDRFLQMFDLTFDVSVQCYTLPVLLGACICTVPHDQVKYLAVYKVLEQHRITIAAMVPSVIGFLMPYLHNIHLPHMRHTIFTGESVPHAVAEAWAQCCPSTLIDDCYGPTEATIYCLSYRWDPKKRSLKSHNGIVSVGKPFRGITARVVDEKDEIVPRGSRGELLIAGDQVTGGYLNAGSPAASSFVSMEGDQGNRIFYRTGDLVWCDEEGDFMYCGRTDHQVQVQGYRVELGEIEYHAGKKVHPGHAVAVAKTDPSGNTEIFLFAETNPERIPEVAACLQSSLPYYMQPLKVIAVDAIPLNANGKTDRNKLLEMTG